MTIFGNPITKVQAWLAAGALAVIFAAICTGTGVKITADLAQNKYDLLIETTARKQAARDLAVATEARRQAKVQSDITLASALANAATQERIVTRYLTRTQEVPKYVTVQQDAVACVSYGLVRVLDAAALGRDPANLELPPGVTDDTCTALKASDLAAGLLGNYSIADRNAAQLDALIADIKARVDAAQPKVSSPPVASYDWGGGWARNMNLETAALDSPAGGEQAADLY